MTVGVGWPEGPVEASGSRAHLAWSIAFEASEALFDLAKQVEGRTDAAVDEELSDPRRFLVVAVDPARTAQAESLARTGVP